LLLKTVAPVFASKQGGEEQIHQHHQVTTARVVDRPTSSAPALVDIFEAADCKVDLTRNNRE
jgi:hypothetical protein